MKRAAVGVVASLLGGLAWAAPVDSLAQKAQVRSAAPTTIDSEASLEYFISQAGRLLKGDTSKDVAAMASRLETLKMEKSAIQQKILEKEREIAVKQAAAAAQAEKAAQAALEALSAQLAKVEVGVRDILAEIERFRAQEQSEKDEIKAAEENLRRFSDSLANAAHQRTVIAGATSSMDGFARGLSAAKKKETEDRVRKALAQLAEARRLRASRLPAVPGPALR